MDTTMTATVTTAIVTALSAGGAFVLKETASEAVRDAYSGLKTWIHDHYSGIRSLERLETEPASKVHQKDVKDELERRDASEDRELLKRAQTLVTLLGKEAPDVVRSIGVDLGVLDRANVTFGNVLAGKGATGVKIEKVIRGTLQFGDVSATAETDPPEKKA